MKNLQGFILLLIAVWFIIPLTIINRWQVRKQRGNTKGYYRNTALNLDIWGNREFRTLWNAQLRTAGGYPFGREGETISSALGKNQRLGTLSKRGRILANLLDWLDKDHCKNSIVDF